MDWDDLFPVFAIAAVASFVLSLKSFFDVRALRAQLAGLTDKLPMYDHWLLRLAERIDGLATAPPPAEPAPPTVEEAPLTPAPEPVREQPVEPAPVAASTTEDFPPTPAAAPIRRRPPTRCRAARRARPAPPGSEARNRSTI